MRTTKRTFISVALPGAIAAAGFIDSATSPANAQAPAAIPAAITTPDKAV
jgi:hypothetical protein